MKRLLFLILSVSFLLPTDAIADCSTSACVDVYTHNNQIIIEARKGSGGSATKKPTVIKPKPAPTLWFPPKPKVVPTVKRTYKPRTVVKKKVVTTSVNLSDG